MEAVISRVQAYLDDINSGLKVIELDEDTSTSELAAKALGVEVGQIAKSIVLKSKKGFFMVVAAGDVRLDAKKLKDLVGGKVRMANPEEVLKATGYPIGGVCPFLLPNGLPIYADVSLQRYDVVYAAAGTANSALPITYEQLLKITGASPCDVADEGA